MMKLGDAAIGVHSSKQFFAPAAQLLQSKIALFCIQVDSLAEPWQQVMKGDLQSCGYSE